MPLPGPSWRKTNLSLSLFLPSSPSPYHHHPLLHTPMMSSRSSVAAVRPLVCSSSDQPLCRCQDLCSWLFPQFCLSPAVFGLSIFGLLLHGRVTHQVRYSPFRCRSLSPSLAAKGPVYCFSSVLLIWWLLLCSSRPNVFGLSLFRRIVLLTCLWSLCILVLAALSLAAHHIWSFVFWSRLWSPNLWFIALLGLLLFGRIYDRFASWRLFLFCSMQDMFGLPLSMLEAGGNGGIGMGKTS